MTDIYGELKLCEEWEMEYDHSLLCGFKLANCRSSLELTTPPRQLHDILIDTRARLLLFEVQSLYQPDGLLKLKGRRLDQGLSFWKFVTDSTDEIVERFVIVNNSMNNAKKFKLNCKLHTPTR